MKKRLIGSLTLLVLLLGASLAWADMADDIRRSLDALPAHMNVEYGQVEALNADTVLVSNLSITSFNAEPGQEAGKGFKTTINTLEITGFNAGAFDDPNPSLLAERIVAKNIRILSLEDDSIVTIKQFSMDKPLAPWASLSQLRGQPKDEIWRQLAYVRIGAFAMENMQVADPAFDVPLRLSLDRFSAQNLNLLYCTDMRLHNLKIMDADAANPALAIADISFNYNFYDYLLPLIMQPDFSLQDVFQLDPTNKYQYEFVVSSLKSTMGSLPFTIKSIRASQDNHNNFNGRFKLDSLRFENKDLRENVSWGASLDRHLLKGKPLLFTLDIQSSINVGKFLPSSVTLQMPGIADLDFKANMALEADYLHNLIPPGDVDVLDFMFDFDEQLDWILDNSLLQDMSVTYRDKGFINGVISYFMEDEQASAAAVKARWLAEIDSYIAHSEPGFARDFMKNLKSLVQKPGKLTLSMTPDKPIDISGFMLMLSQEPQRVKYSFTRN